MDHTSLSRNFSGLWILSRPCGRRTGCPWDREQTIDTLKPYVLEETYEVLEAIDRHDHQAICEELGDCAFPKRSSSRSSSRKPATSRSWIP